MMAPKAATLGMRVAFGFLTAGPTTSPSWSASSTEEDKPESSDAIFFPAPFAESRRRWAFAVTSFRIRSRLSGVVKSRKAASFNSF